MEFRAARLPMPQPFLRSHPEIPSAIFVQAYGSQPKLAVFTEALDATRVNRAQPAPRSLRSAGPDDAFAVLDELADSSSVKLLVVPELPILPAREAAIGPDPQRSVAGDN